MLAGGGLRRLVAIGVADRAQRVVHVDLLAAMGEGAYASGFSVASYDDVMQGTSLGPVVVAGSSMSSALYLVVAGKTDPAIRMPPHHDESWAEGRGVPLSANQIEMIAAWIDQGAKNN